MNAAEKKELLKTLDSIRKLCAATERCIDCPLCVTRGCQLLACEAQGLDAYQ